MALTAEQRERRSRIAAIMRHHPDRPELIDAERRALKVDAIARSIERARHTNPPLTDDDMDRLRNLLPPVVS